jgi:peptidoglycan/LPS O-acetylase OafA/YrhL
MGMNYTFIDFYHQEWLNGIVGEKIVQFTNYSPFFKGSALIILGLLALLFAFWINKKRKEPFKGGFLVFVSLAAFIVLFGLYITIFQPAWWKLPY